MKLLSLIGTALLFTQVAVAGVIKYEDGTRTINGVSVGRSAELSVDNGVYHMDVIGAGLRTKKVLVANVNVYVAQVYVDNAGAFVRTADGAVKSIDNMKAGAIRLTFLRDVEADKVKVSFRDAFDANDINTDEPGIAAFLNAVSDGGDAEGNKTLNISFARLDDGSVRVIYEDTKGKETTVIGNAALANSIFAIWLGEPADAGLATLKKELLKGITQ